MRPRASQVAKTEGVLLPLQSVFVATLISGNRRLVEPKQASTRMDTLGEDTIAS